jgi:hypothetical protein
LVEATVQVGLVVRVVEAEVLAIMEQLAKLVEVD